MVLPSFTPEQIIGEFEKDLANIFYFADHKKQQLRRAALKAHKFPVSIHGWHKTPMNNNWLYILTARTKKDWGETSMVTFVMTFRDQQGKTWAIMKSSIKEQPLFVFYVPHLFARYNERMGLELSGNDLIYRYFKRNSSASFAIKTTMINDTQCKQDITATTQEGVTMGLMTMTGALLKTFISYEMAKGEQIENFTKSEKIRQEMEEIYLNDLFDNK